MTAFASRRTVLAALAGAVASGNPLPVRAITKGPRFHWFGYFDKLQFDATSRYALGVSNDFQHRLPTPDDTIKLGMVDLEDGDRWIELGESKAWSWHQACSLQWLPGSKDEVIWNDRQGTDFVSHILNVRTRKKRTLPKPIFCISPDARWALAGDFARAASMRGAIGYAGGIDPYAGEPAPAKSGIWRMDLQTGAQELIVSLADVVKIPSPQGGGAGAKHCFVHLLLAPDGKRFAFHEQWSKGTVGKLLSRMYTADTDGKNVRIVDDTSSASHYNWRDPSTLVVYMKSNGGQWVLVDDRTNKTKPLDANAMKLNGHGSYLPGRRWFVSDTSPDEGRKQHVYLYDTKSRRKVELGAFYSPPEFKGAWRCDTTPRCSPDGKKVIVDSPHDGKGRQMYLIDVSKVVG